MSEETMLAKIYEKFKDLKRESKDDCTLDKTNLDSAFNVTMCLEKWIRKKTEWSRVYRDLEEKRKKHYRTLYEFYQTDYPLKLSTKDEYNLFIESDPGYVDHFAISQTVKEILQFIDSIIDTLKNKQWERTNWVDYQKFINGR
jgi:hypothetical protein